MRVLLAAGLLLIGLALVHAEDKDRDRDESNTISVRLPGSKIVLSQGMSDDQVTSAFRPGAVAMDSRAGTGGMANVKASFGDYIVTLSSVNHTLKGFGVAPADAGNLRTSDALRSWFETCVKRLKSAVHQSSTNESSVPFETWSTPETEWAIWTVTDKPSNIRHPVYHVTFTAAPVDDDD
jgi:hypothetical protein